MASTEALALRAFAARMNWKPGYVSQLKAADRLVLDAQGLVLVAESLQRIKDTSDPAKFAVAAHHAAKRGEGSTPTPPATDSPPPAASGDDSAKTDSYQTSRARREHYLALAAERDYQESMGQLLPADEVLGALSNAIATLRKGLEAVADIMAPQLAPITDEHTTRTMLAEAIEHALEDTARQFNRITKHQQGETP